MWSGIPHSCRRCGSLSKVSHLSYCKIQIFIWPFSWNHECQLSPGKNLAGSIVASILTVCKERSNHVKCKVERLTCPFRRAFVSAGIILANSGCSLPSCAKKGRSSVITRFIGSSWLVSMVYFFRSYTN